MTAPARRALYVVSCLAALVMSATLGHARAAAQSATVSMSADHASLAVGDTLVLEIRADATGGALQLFEPPDVTGFDVVSRRVATPMSFQFGFGGQTQVMQSSSVQTLQLIARRPGRYELKPARVMVGGRRFLSNRLTILVVPAGQTPPPEPSTQGLVPLDPTQPGGTQTPPGDPQTPPGGGPPLGPPTGTLDGAAYDPQAFIRTVVDKPTPYVGEQVTVTIYLYVSGGIRSAPAASREPSAEGFWVHDLLPPQRTLEATEQAVGGNSFRVYVLRRFAAFPLHAGELSIGPMTVDVQGGGSVFDLFGGAPQRTMHREGVPMPVHVRELPAAGRPSGEVHVGRFTVEAALDRTQVATGDAVTLTARVRGTGNLRDVRIATPVIDGLSIMEPQLKDQIDAPSDLVGGTRTFEWLVVARRPGTFAISPLGVATLDPATGAYARAEGTALTLTAAGNAAAPEPPDAPPVDPTAEAPTGDEPGAGYGPLRTDSALLRHLRPLPEQPWFPWALGAPPALLLITLLAAALRRRAAARAGANAPQRAVKGARKRLARAETLARAGDARGYYGEVASALRAVLEARLGEPIGGLTLGRLRAHLLERGMAEELATRIVEELEGAEFARFSAAGAGREEMDRTSDRVQALIERVDRFAPVATERA